MSSRPDSPRAGSRSLACLVACLLVSLPALAGAGTVPPEPVEFWVVEPNEGDSSGGHAALRLGDSIYHVEHRGDGLIADRRTPRVLFEIAYRGRGNRAISAIPLALDRGDARALEDRLEARAFDRTRRLDGLDSLALQHAFLDRAAAIGAIEIDVPGLGLFESTRTSCRSGRNGRSSAGATGYELERRLAVHYGPNWLGERRRRAHAETARRLHELIESPPTVLPAGVSKGAKFPSEAAAHGGPFRQLVEAAQAAAAFDFAAECRPVRPERLVAAEPLSARAEPLELSRAEWERIREALAARWIALADSDRPDLGLALLLARARLEALDRSISTGRLHLLDSYLEIDDLEAPVALLEGVPTQWIPRLADSIESNAHVARERLRTGRLPLEARLADVERSEHALRHLRNNTRHDRRAAKARNRSFARLHAPAKRTLPWPKGKTVRDVEDARDRSAVATRALRDELGNTLDYTLMTRNCVTELLAELDSLAPPESAPPTLRDDRAASAGDVLRGLFIPVVAGRAVSTTRASGPPRRLGSAREIELRAGGARSTSERLRETNTLTARTYRRHAADSHFLFFPQPVWLRPIAGLANLGYGLAHASLGLLTAPFDRGERLRRGAMGAVMSVPELFFFRVRQGSYPATPPDLLARPDRTHEESGEGSSADGRSRVEVADPMLSSGLAAPQSAGFAAVPPSASAGSSSTR